MRKKDILLLDPGKVENKEKIIKAKMLGQDLILFCFKDKKLFARYCMRHNWSYEVYENDIWSQKKLHRVFGYEWSYSDYQKKVKFYSSTDEDLVKKFTEESNSWANNTLSKIDNMESEHLRRKRELALESKARKIKNVMDLVTPLPPDFEAWCNRVIFKNVEFMFYDKLLDNYRCTACGGIHKVKGLGHNKPWTCHVSGKQVIVKRKQRNIIQREGCMVLQRIDAERSIARHFVVKKEWHGNKSEFNVYEEIRYILYPADAKGIGIYYGQKYCADEFTQEWWHSNPINKRCCLEYCYPEGCEEAMKGTVYEKIGIHLLAAKGWKLQYNNIMINYSRCGFLEYMVKGNYERLTSETSEDFTAWSGYYGMLNLKGKIIQEVLGIDLQRAHRLRQQNGGNRYLEWLRWEQQNRFVPEETIGWLEENKISPNKIKFILDRMSPIQVSNYLIRQVKQSKKSITWLLETWEDYLSMANRLHMDMMSELVYRPKNLVESHNDLVMLIEKNKAALQEEEILVKFPLVNKICVEIKRKYEYADDTYAIVVPDGIQDIIIEGKVLQHCMDKTDRYFNRINIRETYILFLRKVNEIKKPYYTLEVEPNGTIRQKRTIGDKQNPDIEDAKIFLAKWQKELQRRITKEDKKLGEKSRKLRIDGYRELREKKEKVWNGVHAGELLADVLEADLMEVVNA